VNFNSFIALYVIFGVLTFILIALLNVYIPHCMRLVKQKEAVATPGADTPSNHEQRSGSSRVARNYGFSMSIFGSLAVALSATLMLVIVIVIARTLPGPNGQSAGLLVTTIIGFLTMAGALGAYFGLPALPTKPYPEVSGRKTALLELFTPYREMLLRKRNMLFLLLAYTIYTDTLFAVFSITGQLYFTEIKPDTLEYSLYSLSGNLYSLILTMAFYLLQRRFQWDLAKCLIFGYALMLIVPVWGCIGLAGNVDFGFKASTQSLLLQFPDATWFSASTNIAHFRIDGNSTCSCSSAISRKPSLIRLSGYCSQSWCLKAKRSCGLGCK
jgi:Vacuole effluxer Atg22 like